jgi:hypothetical protein
MFEAPIEGNAIHIPEQYIGEIDGGSPINVILTQSRDQHSDKKRQEAIDGLRRMSGTLDGVDFEKLHEERILKRAGFLKK